MRVCGPSASHIFLLFSLFVVIYSFTMHSDARFTSQLRLALPVFNAYTWNQRMASLGSDSVRKAQFPSHGVTIIHTVTRKRSL